MNEPMHDAGMETVMEIHADLCEDIKFIIYTFWSLIEHTRARKTGIPRADLRDFGASPTLEGK